MCPDILDSFPQKVDIEGANISETATKCDSVKAKHGDDDVIMHNDIDDVEIEDDNGNDNGDAIMHDDVEIDPVITDDEMSNEGEKNKVNTQMNGDR